MMCMHDARRKRPGNCRVETRVQMAAADGAVVCGVDLNEAISKCAAVPWHSSYPWAATQSTRRFGGLTAIMYDGDGHSFVGLLGAAVDVARTWGVDSLPVTESDSVEQRYLGMICRLELQWSTR